MIWSLFREDYLNSELRHFSLSAFDVVDQLLELPKRP